ncbi:MAG: hypothetical protein HKN72_01445 [Gemmatimonadetes bacterium]|nr:hypothetical protein [Gemmatimonadota bacterium]NNF11856.1 hypothetical protein [Gemmatimonadota bacterium]
MTSSATSAVLPSVPMIVSAGSYFVRIALRLLAVAMTTLPMRVAAQEVFPGEVRQLVTFRFVPGGATAARTIFRERALPLYELDTAMRSFRAFREVESSIPLDLIVVSSFEGMAGMDEHNRVISGLPGPDGMGIGGFYGAIGDLIAAHDDQFVAMLPDLSHGDPTSRPRVALVWYRILPGQSDRFEEAIQHELLPRERSAGLPSATGRFLLSDGWHYLRMLGFDSLGAYQAYWDGPTAAGHEGVDGVTTERREVILAPVPELAVR